MASSLEDLVTKFESFDLMMNKVLDKVTGLEAWQSSADASMGLLLTKADDTASRLQRLESAPPPRPQPPPPQPPLPPQLPAAWTDPLDLNLAPGQATRSFASTWERPHGHRVEHGHRDVGGGILGSHPPRPVTGMPPTSLPPIHDLTLDLGASSVRVGPTPKMDFPKFDGSNPRLWKDKCELFFEVYCVSESLKPRFAALNFSGSAASWLQTLERRGRVGSWEELHKAVCNRFDRDQYSLHMRQLDSLRQTGSVDEYHAQAPIALHRPSTVDTASALALLQEEELECQRRQAVLKPAHKDLGKSGSQVFSANDKSRFSGKRMTVNGATSQG
ncbi:hypothetical protein PVAP13_6NG073760 [Panicum virgatum]|uniref:Retrotransposon gag domain-containing protein n=1 Tax=Panicum virgatum TaxID=38727 RepID=A0A8T0QVT0_PANVG|nr:hypothetical protein PVAP13_6NG073760 [Panicum virgatum]